MNITLVGTSNCILGEWGFVKALREEHAVVNLSLGRAHFYMHISRILDNLNLIQDSDCLIIDHLSNITFMDVLEQDLLQDFYNLLASLNTNVIILCFPFIFSDSQDVFENYRLISEQLAKERNLTFINVKYEYFSIDNFLDNIHLERYPSYLLGEWLLDVLNQSVFFSKPQNGFFNGYSVLKPTPTDTFSNSYLSVKYCEVTCDEVVIEQNGKNISLLSMEYKSNGFIRFRLNGTDLHVISEDMPVINEPFGFEFKISGNLHIKKIDKGESRALMGRIGEGISENLKLISILTKETNTDYLLSSNRTTICFDLMKLKVKVDNFNLLTSMHKGISRSNLAINKENRKDNIIDTLRDSAMLIESTDLQKAYILMDTAAINRPDGLFLQKKREEYSRRLNKKLDKPEFTDSQIIESRPVTRHPPVSGKQSFEITHYPFTFSPQDSEEIVAELTDIFCPVCGQQSKIEPYGVNRRETGVCKNCGSWNRQRLLALFLVRAIERSRGKRLESLSSESLPGNLDIYSAEWYGAIHKTLKRLNGYQWSRYSGSQYVSGEVVDGIPHQDLTRTSFSNDSFDFVLTADVLEHIPDPYLAHREIYRILRPGGKHIFTVPSQLNVPVDDQNAVIVGDKVVYLATPHWHGKNEDSNLVYNVFGLEMVTHLWAIGFYVEFHEISKPELGIIGPRSFIFEAKKHHPPLDREIPKGLRAVNLLEWSED